MSPKQRVEQTQKLAERIEDKCGISVDLFTSDVELADIIVIDRVGGFQVRTEVEEGQLLGIVQRVVDEPPDYTQAIFSSTDQHRLLEVIGQLPLSSN